MTEFNFTDTATIKKSRKTDLGYLCGVADIARTGIQYYAGHEVGMPSKPIVAVYRSEDEVFKRESLASFVGKPITDGHPDELVTADNWKEYSRGNIGSDVLRNGDKIQFSYALMDAKAIERVESGVASEVSVGYRAKLKVGDGITPDGQKFDAQQTEIIVDHVAIVPKGRAGPEFRMGDGQPKSWGAAPINDQSQEGNAPMKVVLVDSIPVNVADDAGEAVVRKLVDEAVGLRAKVTTDAAAHVAAITAKDTKIGELTAEVQKLKDAALDTAAIDKLVADRVSLVTDAKAIFADAVTDGIKDADIRKAVVSNKYGDDFVTGMSDAEINGVFRVLAKDAKESAGDPLTNVMKGGVKSQVADAWDDSVFASAGLEMNKGAN